MCLRFAAGASCKRRLPAPAPLPAGPPLLLSLSFVPPPQAGATGKSGWENWMRSAWGRWHRTKDATQESWDSAKDQAYRWAAGGEERGERAAAVGLLACCCCCTACSAALLSHQLTHYMFPSSFPPSSLPAPPQGVRHCDHLLPADLGRRQGRGAAALGRHQGQERAGERAAPAALFRGASCCAGQAPAACLPACLLPSRHPLPYPSLPAARRPGTTRRAPPGTTGGAPSRTRGAPGRTRRRTQSATGATPRVRESLAAWEV